jgi:putative transposase
MPVVFSTKDRRNLIPPDKPNRLWSIAQKGSSKWLNETIATRFEWQQGYGAFSVGVSQKNHTVAYIEMPRDHHRRGNFEEEFVAFLKKHDVARYYDIEANSGLWPTI